ncbi:MAG TPA: hypothetical protein PL124_10705 [Candidatus Cloacimonadota bacterium]|nr:hypothetical protein [Candidatus Cloacimonadota bacterium]
MPNEQDQTVETEVVSAGEHEVELQLTPDTNTLTVKLPEGLSEEERTKIKTSIENGEVGKLSAAYYKRLHEMNKREEEWKAAVEAERQTKPDPAKDEPTPTGTEPIWKMLGLNAADEIQDFITDNADGLARYHEAVEKQADQRHQQSLRAALAEQEMKTRNMLLEQDLSHKGIDVAEARAFAKSYGMPFSEKSIGLYVQLHADKSNPVLAAQAAARNNQISFIEQSNYRFPTGTPSADELDKMSPEQQDAYLEEAKRRALNS